MHIPCGRDITGEVGGVAVTVRDTARMHIPCGRDITGEVGGVAVTV